MTMIQRPVYTTRLFTVSAAAAALFVLSTAPALADEDISKPEELVAEAEKTFADFVADPEMKWFRSNVKNAKAVFIVPRLMKAGFLFGGSGGSGVLLSRDERGAWSYPSFHTMGSGSFGLQAGIQSAEVVLMVMTQKGVDALLSTKAQLGADVSVALGPIGAGAQAATVDILQFARTKGAFGGISAEGAVIAVRDQWNEEYYGKPVRPTDIIVKRNVNNPDAKRLRAAVASAGEGLPAVGADE
jgi:lipid-binding SYLF domain-containing protein